MYLPRQQPVVLDPEGVKLLDIALRIAYTRLIDAGVMHSRGVVLRARDELVRAMIAGISKGEKDVWRLARRGIFTVCASLANEAQRA
jgi:hypothetical protein